MKQCFVISPIGQEGTEVRQHADDVFEYIISPAMDECGIKAFRSDHLDKPGKITEQMFEYLYTADLCIAVLTGFNPNVFYELAIAQSAQRPVILLIEKGHLLPFDIQDLRSVVYDLQIRSYEERTHINKIINYVREFEATDWNPPRSIPISVPEDNKHEKFFERSMDYGNKRVWLQLLRNTNNVFEIMGITLSSWRRTKGFKQLLIEKAANGCKVRVLLMHRDNPVFEHIINRANPDVLYDSIQGETEYMFEYFSKVSEKAPGVEVRQMRVGCPHFQITRTDQYINFISYLYSEKSGDSPLWQYDQRSNVYSTMAQEFNDLWAANDPDSMHLKN